jgi:hypothetical protein
MRGMRNCAGFVHEGMKNCARFVHEEGMTNRAGFVDKASERVCMTNKCVGKIEIDRFG